MMKTTVMITILEKLENIDSIWWHGCTIKTIDAIY